MSRGFNKSHFDKIVAYLVRRPSLMEGVGGEIPYRERTPEEWRGYRTLARVLHEAGVTKAYSEAIAKGCPGIREAIRAARGKLNGVSVTLKHSHGVRSMRERGVVAGTVFKNCKPDENSTYGVPGMLTQDKHGTEIFLAEYLYK